MKHKAKQQFNIIFINDANSRLALIYRKGKLSEVKQIQTLQPQYYDWLTYIAPFQVENIPAIQERYKDKLTYTEVVKDKEFNLNKYMTGVWFSFYEKRFSIKPKHAAVEGKALKGIITYLKKLCNDENEVYAVWCDILKRWSELDPFTQSKCELVYINAKLNLIIQQLKPSANEEEDRNIFQ